MAMNRDMNRGDREMNRDRSTPSQGNTDRDRNIGSGSSVNTGNTGSTSGSMGRDREGDRGSSTGSTGRESFGSDRSGSDISE